ARGVEGIRDIHARRRQTADDLWRVLGIVLLVAGIDALGAKGQKDILANGEPLRLELRQDQFARRAWVRRAFQHDQHALLAILRDRVGRLVDIAHVGVARFDERRRHRDRDGMARPELRRIGRRLEVPGRDQRGDVRRRDILNVRRAGHQDSHDALADIVAHDVESRLRELHREGEPDVTEADHADDRRAIVDLGEQLVFHATNSRTAATTSSSWARVSSGYTGSDSTSREARSASGSWPSLYPKYAK